MCRHGCHHSRDATRRHDGHSTLLCLCRLSQCTTGGRYSAHRHPHRVPPWLSPHVARMPPVAMMAAPPSAVGTSCAPDAESNRERTPAPLRWTAALSWYRPHTSDDGRPPWASYRCLPRTARKRFAPEWGRRPTPGGTRPQLPRQPPRGEPPRPVPPSTATAAAATPRDAPPSGGGELHDLAAGRHRGWGPEAGSRTPRSR